jgi:hypothetical protein
MLSDLVNTYKCFYLLNDLSPTGTYSTFAILPEGRKLVDFIDVINEDGVLLAAWKEPFQLIPYQNVVVSDGETEQIVNLMYIERVIDTYDRPPSSDIGTFLFMNSLPIPSKDWRCDEGKYGGVFFNVPDIPYSGASEIKHYDVLLPFNGIAQIAYSESKEKQPLSDYLVDADEIPSTTRTLAELLRLVYEWSESYKEPFNNNEPIAQKAHQFIDLMKLSDEEKNLLEAQTPMQVSNYIMGSTDARKRPKGTLPITDGLMKMLFKRMSSSSLSALAQLNGIQWNIEELVRLEKEELLSGISRFKQFYEIDDSIDILNEDEWETVSDTFVSSFEGYVKGMELFMLNQMRNFVNKNKVLDLVLVNKFK